MNPHYQTTQLFVTRHPFAGCIGLHLMQRERGGKNENRVAVGLDFKILSDGEDAIAPLPLLRISNEDAQQFMDELWNAGIRPTDGAGSAGAMAAVQRHLEDMRALVFKSQPATK